MENLRFQFISTPDYIHFFWKNIFKIRWKYSLRISKSVVSWCWLQMPCHYKYTRFSPEYNLDPALNNFLKTNNSNSRFESWWQWIRSFLYRYNKISRSMYKSITNHRTVVIRRLKIWQMIWGSSSRKYNVSLHQGSRHMEFGGQKRRIFIYIISTS